MENLDWIEDDSPSLPTDSTCLIPKLTDECDATPSWMKLLPDEAHIGDQDDCDAVDKDKTIVDSLDNSSIDLSLIQLQMSDQIKKSRAVDTSATNLATTSLATTNRGEGLNEDETPIPESLEESDETVVSQPPSRRHTRSRQSLNQSDHLVKDLLTRNEDLTSQNKDLQK